jgi:hypothetical protein
MEPTNQFVTAEINCSNCSKTVRKSSWWWTHSVDGRVLELTRAGSVHKVQKQTALELHVLKGIVPLLQ